MQINTSYAYVQYSTTLDTQKNIRNFSTIASQVSSSLADITDESTTTRLEITALFHQLKESLYAVSRTTERLSHETRRRTNRQHHWITNKCLCDLHTTFTWEEIVCSYQQLRLDWPARQHAADAGPPPTGARGHLPIALHVRATSEAWRGRDTSPRFFKEHLFQGFNGVDAPGWTLSLLVTWQTVPSYDSWAPLPPSAQQRRPSQHYENLP